MPGGSTLRQCTHCLEKINCANRRCTKCGKLLDMKSRQTTRMKGFRTRATEWAQKVKKSRNQAKIFDNSALLVEKLKALGYFPLLLWGKYRPQNKKWRAQLQYPFELPVVAHVVLEKILCLFEGLLEGRQLSKFPLKVKEAKTMMMLASITAHWTFSQCNMCPRHVKKKGCKEVLVHWLPCPSCQKAWPPSWEPQENIRMTVS
ncbi:uncharacterized protein LOC127638074 isoform X3 [Xyrauchen texanus]|uniref:uncharacterized protein LOC127638074 isoform X3 n=1 Tax=Xyrauchen texanus TaxID=154827 RepID=UPI002242AF03|nr:uncharacterized protein LOC127638074 isoform X3 [Xyrauchen texanus]